MAEQRDDFTWLELYLAGELSPEEKTALEARLQAEAPLQTQLREQQEAILALQILEKDALRTQLQQDWQQIKKQEAPKTGDGKVRRMIVIGLALAASLALLFWIFRPSPSVLTGPELAMQYFDPDPAGMVRGSAEKADWAAAILAYQDKDYAQAEGFLQKDIAQHPSDARTRLYLGMSQLAQQKATNAIETLSPLLDHAVADERARWNLVLAYLSVENQPQADALLKEIVDTPGHYMQEQAQKLQDEW